MGIWIWIVMAWILTAMLLRKQKISLEHYVWMFLPIDMYGISIAGAVIKPYILFCFFLFARILLKKDFKLRYRSQWVLTGGFLSVLMILVNLINNSGFSAAKAALLVFLVWFCSVIYLSQCGESSKTDISKVLIATGVGYGVVFVLGYLLAIAGVEIPGVYAMERDQQGFFLRFANVYEGNHIVMYRLRGFTIDPNTMIGTFAFGGVTAILKIIKGKGKILEWMCIILSAVCVLLSNSRMGLICFAFLCVAAVIVGYRVADARTRSFLKVGAIFMILIGIFISVTTDILSRIVDEIVANYANRSSLNDEFGRFTVWQDAISVFLMSKNPLLGVGMGQMQYYTASGRACHNTWLEMICGSGILVGGALVLYFVLHIITGIFKANKLKSSENSELIWCMILGVLVVAISLISVDNITYSYLWFGLAVFSFAVCEQNTIISARRKISE